MSIDASNVTASTDDGTPSTPLDALTDLTPTQLAQVVSLALDVVEGEETMAQAVQGEDPLAAVAVVSTAATTAAAIT